MDTKKLEKVLNEDGIIFLTYGGFLTQSLIVGMTEALEKESEYSDIGSKTSHNIFAIFIELSQNMMNYTKSRQPDTRRFDSKGMIIVGKNSQEQYYVLSQNPVGLDDKNKMDSKLQEIVNTDLEGVKKLYKEARRSGKYSHSKGGGIGFYEIAKRSHQIDYDFESLGGDTFNFKFKATL